MSMTLDACEYWVGMDEWMLIQAPLLLVEVDPSVVSQHLMKKLEDYFESNVQIEPPNTAELSKETMQEAWRIYQRFRRVEFGLKYSTDPYYNLASSMYRRAYHPYLFMREAIIRNISIPENLKTAIDDRHLRENKNTFFESGSSDIEEELKQKQGRSHEYDNIGKGLMALVLSKKSGLFVSGNKVNASQIKKAVLDAAKEYGITPFGLGILERDISAGIMQIQKNYNLFIDKNES